MDNGRYDPLAAVFNKRKPVSMNFEPPKSERAKGSIRRRIRSCRQMNLVRDGKSPPNRLAQSKRRLDPVLGNIVIEECLRLTISPR
jgi:hypothetical protein